jgi:hypothetical protein
MLDMFGPYVVKEEVQKRVSGKAYGVIFTDLVVGALHIEAVYGYHRQSFLMALSRFACILGWPATIYSDPGSQLVGADRELKRLGIVLIVRHCIKMGLKNGLTWLLGPAESLWNQGKVEALVKAAKRAIHFAVHNKRLLVSEFLTICYEAANLLNERPIVRYLEQTQTLIFSLRILSCWAAPVRRILEIGSLPDNISPNVIILYKQS